MLDRYLFRSASSALLLVTLLAGCAADDPEPAKEAPLPPVGPLLVQTDKGPVEGVIIDSTRAFFGIPFAAPPVGDLRWKSPMPHEPWSETLKANKKGPACTQFSALGSMLDLSSQEDCLTINVWAPERVTNPPPPVLVWIYGGGFTIGSNRDLAYDGQLLAEATGAVIVNLNYRLGPLGGLALSALESEDPAHPSTGAYGIEDQRAALQWVKANIAAFGGDPNNVMLFGESAGGISTCLHLVSPLSKDLFHSAVIQSGPCDSAQPKDKALAQGDQFAAALGCKDVPDALACLRGKTTEEVMKALPSSSDILFGNGASWMPVLDGWNIPDKPSVLLESGKFNKVPTILGANADEGTLFFQLAGTKIADDMELVTFAEELVPGHGQEVAALYSSAKFGTAQDGAMAAVGHGGFVCPTRRAARAITKAGGSAYHYHFTYAPPGALLGDGLGAFHAAEIKFVFGRPSLLLPQPLTDDEIVLSNAMMGYWSRLAAGGDPNGKNAIVWPKYDAAKDETLELTLAISSKANVNKELCDFWDTVEVMAP